VQCSVQCAVAPAEESVAALSARHGRSSEAPAAGGRGAAGQEHWSSEER